MQGIPSYYGADDLLLNALYDEGCKICGNKPASPTANLTYPVDSFHKTTTSTTKENAKKGLTVGGILAGLGALTYGTVKLFKKVKP